MVAYPVSVLKLLDQRGELSGAQEFVTLREHTVRCSKRWPPKPLARIPWRRNRLGQYVYVCKV